jgi:hypothetical protein
LNGWKSSNAILPRQHFFSVAKREISNHLRLDIEHGFLYACAWRKKGCCLTATAFWQPIRPCIWGWICLLCISTACLGYIHLIYFNCCSLAIIPPYAAETTKVVFMKRKKASWINYHVD